MTLKEKFLHVCKTKPLKEAIKYFNSLSMSDADDIIEEFSEPNWICGGNEKTLTVIRNGLKNASKYENFNKV